MALWTRDVLEGKRGEPSLEGVLRELDELGLYGERFCLEGTYVARLARYLGVDIKVVDICDSHRREAYTALVRQRITAALLRDTGSWGCVVLVPEGLSGLSRMFAIAHELSHVACADPLRRSREFFVGEDGDFKSDYGCERQSVESDAGDVIRPPGRLRISSAEPPPGVEASDRRAEERAHLLMLCALYGDRIVEGEQEWLFRLNLTASGAET